MRDRATRLVTLLTNSTATKSDESRVPGGTEHVLATNDMAVEVASLEGPRREETMRVVTIATTLALIGAYGWSQGAAGRSAKAQADADVLAPQSPGCSA